MKKSVIKKYSFDMTLIISFSAFVTYSICTDYLPGIKIFEDNFLSFTKEMILALPVMFIFVGLFDVWVSKEKVTKLIGKSSGIKGVMLVMALAFLQAGPIYAAFPVAYILRKKGTSPANIFIYLSAASIVKIPMLTFEIGFLGLKFSLLRIFLSLPVFVIVGIIMGKYFENNKLEIKNA